MEIQTPLIPLQEIKDAVTQKHAIRLFVLRLDLNHELISGNKLVKLKYNLIEAKRQGKDTLLTFGGAFSNHIAAAAAAGKEYGFKTIGVIRGEQYPELNPTLKFADSNGMHLHYVTREAYRTKTTPEFIDSLRQKFGDFYLVPEGGSNDLAIKGCKEITSDIPIDFDVICSACGTGATFSGIVLSLKNHQRGIGFQILKGENYLQTEVNRWISKFSDPSLHNYYVNESFHFGGYAKVNLELYRFVRHFELENNVPLDYCYTGKMMFGIYKLIQSGYFEKGKTIVAVHTGGLQGNEGFKWMN